MNNQQINIKLCVQKKRDEFKNKKCELIKKRSELLKHVIQVNTVLCKLHNFSKQEHLQILENDLNKNQNLLQEIENNIQKIKSNTDDLVQETWNELKCYTEKMGQKSRDLLDLENKYASSTLKNRIKNIEQHVISYKNKSEYENETYSKLLNEFDVDISNNLSEVYETMLNELRKHESDIERKYYILNEQNNRLLQQKRKSI